MSQNIKTNIFRDRVSLLTQNLQTINFRTGLNILFFSVKGLECASCAHLIFDTGNPFLNNIVEGVLDFTSEDCTDSVSYDVLQCSEGEVCMAINTELKVSVVTSLGGKNKCRPKAMITESNTHLRPEHLDILAQMSIRLRPLHK